MKIDHHIIIGETQFTLKIAARMDGERVIIDPNSLINEQRLLGLRLVSEGPKYTQELANFLLNVSGLKGKDIASLMWTQASTVSKLRKGEEVNKATWKLFLIIMAQNLDKQAQKNSFTDNIINMPLRGNVA